MIIATCGHVDHGKTSLVRAITGVDTDRLEEEKRRGLTIETGFAYTTCDDVRLGFVDVPGHRRFISNMLAGVSMIDLGLLVVAADDGIMPQTLEHLAILALLQIPRCVVAVTKIDRVDSARVDQVLSDIAELLATGPYHDSPRFAVCNATGDGVGELAGYLTHEAIKHRRTSDTHRFRLAVDRVFTIKGTGLVVTGSVFSGSASIGDELNLLPRLLPVRIRGIHCQNEPAETARLGDRAALNIAGQGLDRDKVSRGDWLCAGTLPWSRRLDASVTVLPGERALRHWTPVHLHIAANDMTARVATLGQASIAPGETGLVQLVLASNIHACRDDRFVLRDQAATRTIAGGRIIDPLPAARGRNRPARLAQLNALQAESLDQRLLAASEAYTDGLNLAAFCAAENIDDDTARKLPTRVAGIAVKAGYAVTVARLAEIRQSVLDVLHAFHTAEPNASGPTLAKLRGQLQPAPPSALLAAILDDMVAEKRLRFTGGCYSLPGQRPRLDDAQQRLWQQIEPLLAESGTRPPVVHDIAARLDTKPANVERCLLAAMQLGLVVRPVGNRFFLPGAIEELQGIATELASNSNDGFTVKQFRDASAIGRNLSIEILEYFDASGLTIRSGDHRTIRKHH